MRPASLLLLVSALGTAPGRVEAQQVVLRTVAAGSARSADAAEHWEQVVRAGSGAEGTGTMVERITAGSRHRVGIGDGALRALSVRSVVQLSALDSLVLGDVSVAAPIRATLPGPVLGRRAAFGATLALPRWHGAAAYATLATAPRRAYAGGVNGLALGGGDSRGALRSADFGEPDCPNGPAWSCTLVALELQRPLPRGGGLMTNLAWTSDVAAGDGDGSAQLVVNGGRRSVGTLSVEPGAALHVGGTPGVAVWNRLQGQQAGLAVRASRGTLLRPARMPLPRAGSSEEEVPDATAYRERAWEERRAAEANVDAWWTPRPWLRASAGLRTWSERTIADAQRGVASPADVLDPAAVVSTIGLDDWAVSGATRGRHVGIGTSVAHGRWQGSLTGGWWTHARSGAPGFASGSLDHASSPGTLHDGTARGQDLGLTIVHDGASGGRWWASGSVHDAGGDRRWRAVVRRDQPLGLRAGVSPGIMLRWDALHGSVWAPTAQFRWRTPVAHLVLETQLPLDDRARAERWVGASAEMHLGRWVASVSQVHTVSGLTWRLTARRAWQSTTDVGGTSYERATRGAWWVHGRVITTHGEPLVALPVRVGRELAFTDDEGRFSLRVDAPAAVMVELDLESYPGGRAFRIVELPSEVLPTRAAMPEPGRDALWRVER